ncbi:MAG: MarR family transcriptional regulator [Alistipes sp.]|nr:MarR family transcriptional regulator [Alistipes sp.]
MRNRFETFAICVTELNRCLQKIKEAEMKPFGLQAKHAMCLYYLGRNGGGLTVTQLTNLCHEDKAAVSRSIHQLTEKGFVYGARLSDSEIAEQIPIRQDKRSYRTPYYLTSKGTELVTLIDQRIEAALLHVGSGLSDSRRETFYSTMELILANLTEYVNEKEKNI